MLNITDCQIKILRMHLRMVYPDMVIVKSLISDVPVKTRNFSDDIYLPIITNWPIKQLRKYVAVMILFYKSCLFSLCTVQRHNRYTKPYRNWLDRLSL